MASPAAKVRIGQLGVTHAHAAGKARVLKEAADVDFVGIHEPDPSELAARSANPAYKGVRWLTDQKAVLEACRVDR